MKKYGVYQERRKTLLARVKKANPAVTQGAILLFAGFEHEKYRFRQDSSFYYLTGITEPGVVVLIGFDGKTILFVPSFAQSRVAWMASALTPSMSPVSVGVDLLKSLGASVPGYQLSALFAQSEYQELVTYIKQLVAQGGSIFAANSAAKTDAVDLKCALARLMSFVPDLAAHIQDASLELARMRRQKTHAEIESIYKAIDITMVAQEGAARVIDCNVREAEVQAGIEYIFTDAGARLAFPSIVASGKNSTVLHYHDNNEIMRQGDLVVVDIGAECDYYCADITRTYPVSGKFTQRQREVYEIVLATQFFIAELAKPGMYLRNAQIPEKSLQHLAMQFLQERGYAQYFPHGIGHFLGLDVHDVGDATEPLQEGDVITIEPGIYIPEENIGIRIEDDYWIVKDGAECLSGSLAKDVESIEQMVQSSLEDDEEDDSDDEDYDDFN